MTQNDDMYWYLNSMHKDYIRWQLKDKSKRCLSQTFNEFECY